MTVLRSSKFTRFPGLRHGFSTRKGGVSTGRFEGLNLGRGHDQPEAVEENRRRFREAVGVTGPIWELDQVHGNQVHWVDGSGIEAGTEGDGLLTELPDVYVAVRTADCVPVLLAVESTVPGRLEAAAAIHAGWRSAVGGILGNAVRALVDRGAKADRIWASIGPAICLDHFEVGDEVVESARAALSGRDPKLKLGPRGRALLDLPDTVIRLLQNEGLRTERIDLLGRCTRCEPRSFFSYRRDGFPTGSQLSVVGWMSSTNP